MSIWNLQHRAFDDTHEFREESGSVLRSKQPVLFFAYVECDYMKRHVDVDRIESHESECLVVWGLTSGAIDQSDNSTGGCGIIYSATPPGLKAVNIPNSPCTLVRLTASPSR